MKKYSYNYLFFILLLSGLLSGCQAIGSIFKAGVWSGVLLVVIVVGVIIFIFSRGKKSNM